MVSVRNYKNSVVLSKTVNEIDKEIERLRQLRNDIIWDYNFDTLDNYKRYTFWCKTIILEEQFSYSDIEYINKINEWLDVLYPPKYTLNK